MRDSLGAGDVRERGSALGASSVIPMRFEMSAIQVLIFNVLVALFLKHVFVLNIKSLVTLSVVHFDQILKKKVI